MASGIYLPLYGSCARLICFLPLIRGSLSKNAGFRYRILTTKTEITSNANADLERQTNFITMYDLNFSIARLHFATAGQRHELLLLLRSLSERCVCKCRRS